MELRLTPDDTVGRPVPPIDNLVLSKGEQPMPWFLKFYRSAIGKKAVMAVTGIFIFAWITAHMVGNLKIYLGPQALNHYAEWLRVIGGPAFPTSAVLWITRALLIVATWFHIQAATQLTLMNWKARPVGYRDRDYPAATYAARTMRWGGVIIVLFVIWHLLDLTFGTVNPNFIQGDPYHNVVASFSVWWIASFYVIANVALGFHLYHGLWSLFQSLGWNNPRFNLWRRYFATAFALIIAIGNISIPVSVLAGWVR
ncbi:MAG: succinate dehydrogenase cytochrome b subunit [Thermoanaerobaculia bacterium]